jgi:hypothetical protein
MQLPDYFTSDIQKLRVGDGVSEDAELVERPDDLLRLGIDFDEQWILRPGVALANDVIAVGKDFQRCDPRECKATPLGIVGT